MFFSKGYAVQRSKPLEIKDSLGLSVFQYNLFISNFFVVTVKCTVNKAISLINWGNNI